MPNEKAEPCVIVIFGASGDLTSRKLIPALYEMDQAGHLPKDCCVFGFARSDFTDDGFRDHLRSWAKEHAQDFTEEAWREFAQRLHYRQGDATNVDEYKSLLKKIGELSKQYGCHDNVLYYLAVAPSLYAPIVTCLDQSGAITEGRRWCSIDRDAAPWQRIVVEKPFGSDLESAEELNRVLGRVFDEEAIYRIDHYLGKELVQSLLVFRFANQIFEPLWNHQYIDHVQITAAEKVGVGSRGRFYDEAGAIRDMIQSHLLQVLALVAMEPPTSMNAHHIRQEKIKTIDALQPVTTEELQTHAALGQYAGDSEEKAFHELPEVPRDSTTETYAALKLHFDNWRWSATPFYVRTGKRLAAKRTEIVVRFKQPATNLFRHIEPFNSGGTRPANQIVFEIAPGQGAYIRIEGKVPGSGIKLDSVKMDFDLNERFKAEPLDAYGPLLIDAMRGDQTLYKHRHEVEGAWRAVMPFLGEESAPLRQGIQANYQPGSWGPASADVLLARDGRSWHNE